MVKQQNPQSRILALALAAVLAVGTLVPTGGLVKSYADSGQDSSVVEITKNGTTNTYTTLKDAVDAAIDGDIMKVIADIDLKTEGVIIGGNKALTLDLNGKTITYSGDQEAIALNSGAFTFSDNSTAKNGKLLATSGDAIFIGTNGNLTVTGGTVQTTGTYRSAINNGGTVTVTGGRVEATDATGRAILVQDAKTTISGTAIVTSKNTSTMYPGTIHLFDVPSSPSVILDIQNGTVSNTASPEGYSVYFDDETVTTANVTGYYTKSARATVGREFPALATPPSGGSSGGSSKSNWTPTTSANVIDVPQGTLGLGTYNNYDKLLVQGLEKLVAQSKGKTVNLDRVENGKVLYRVKVDPAKLSTVMKEDLSLNVHYVQNDANVLAVTNRFAKYYSNNMVAVTYDQAKPLSVNAEFAAKLDLSKLNTKTLYFYSYNPTTNSYTRIAAPNYFVDVNGYSHITAPLGGSILITDKPLTAK